MVTDGDVLTVDGNLVQAQVVRFRQNQFRNARSRYRCMVDGVGGYANRLPDSRPLVISREVRENPFSLDKYTQVSPLRREAQYAPDSL